MWSELDKALKQNEEDIRSGRQLPRKTVFIAQPVRIQQFSFEPRIEISRPVNFPVVDVSCPIGSYLKPITRDSRQAVGAFQELVNLDYARTVLEKYSVMAFLSPDGSNVIGADGAVREAEAVQLHAGQPTGPRGGGGRSALPATPAGLENGLWHHIPTGTEFPINDGTYRSGAPGHADVADAPILALGNNLNRVLAVSAETDTWYEEYPPPMAPRNPENNNAYVRSLRSYLKKLAIQLIERDNWFLLWHGFLYTNARPLDFSRVYANSRVIQNLRWPDNVTVTELDANNAAYAIDKFTWGDLKTAKNNRSVGSGGEPGQYASFYRHFQNLGVQLKTDYPQIFTRRPSPATEDVELTGELLHALVEGRLDESLTYNQMLTATATYWQKRLKTVRNVHTSPPGLVMLKDGTVDLSFDFVSRPSTTGRPHQGYVKFIPEKGQPRAIDKLRDFLGRIGQQIKKFIGKKVPPQALKGSDLRKMLCEVSCSCPDFKYRMSYANVQVGVTTAAGRTDNGRAPVRTNPAGRPGFCKHILATLRYLTDDAEIQISKEFTAEQQEALKKDRAQFYKEAQVAYKKMKAPAAKGAEEIAPPEEEPPSPEFAKLPAPPKPERPPPPLVPPTAPTPPTPDYPASQ